MASPLLQLQMNAFQIHGKTLFNAVDISVDRGERIAFVGPSGQGKSTLLKVLCGLLPISTGHLRIEGQDFHQLTENERQKWRSKMGMLFQKNALFDSLTVLENVRFPLREVTKKTEQEIETLSVNCLESVEIFHAKDLYPDEISGGMQKRLGIARAQALSPEIIYYDDPTAGLDPITSRKIIELIVRLQKQQNSTVFVVTNEMPRAYQFATRIFYVGEQQIFDLGGPAEAQKTEHLNIRKFLEGRLE